MRAAAPRRGLRHWAASVLLVTWSLGCFWHVSHALVHALEHAESAHHATPGEDLRAGSEAGLTPGGHSHEHPAEASVLTTKNERFELAAALVSATLTARTPVLSFAARANGEAPAPSSRGVFGPCGPRAPPLS